MTTFRIHDSGKWVLVGADIENRDSPEDPLVRLEVGETDSGPIVVEMYKEVFEELRRGGSGYKAYVYASLDGNIGFEVRYNGRRVPHRPELMDARHSAMPPDTPSRNGGMPQKAGTGHTPNPERAQEPEPAAKIKSGTETKTGEPVVHGRKTSLAARF